MAKSIKEIILDEVEEKFPSSDKPLTKILRRKAMETASYEYKIITGDDTYCQTVLNQWKHSYQIKIIEMIPRGEKITILLIRKEEK